MAIAVRFIIVAFLSPEQLYPKNGAVHNYSVREECINTFHQDAAEFIGNI